jgi:outer membrane lipoprotein-sorting protein
MGVQGNEEAPSRPNSRVPCAREFIATAVLLLVVAGVAAQQRSTRPTDSPRESFDELYRKGQQTNAGIRTLTARFTETTTSPLLTRPLVARGTLFVERPSRVVMRYDEPEQRVVLIDGDRMTMSWPARGLRQVTNIARAQGRVQKYFVNKTSAELRKEFEIEPRATSERPELYEVSMVPKRKQIKETLARLDLWVDPSTSLLAAMRMTFAGGETKLMEFRDVMPNAALAANTFAEPR